MTKQNYVALKELHEAEITEAKKALAWARLNYIDQMSVFALGDRITITRPETSGYRLAHKEPDKQVIIPETIRHAFVYGYDTDSDNDIVYLVKKCKKNGTPSLQSDYYSKDRDILCLDELPW